ncbi:MAG TPA: hypothetical protein VIM69_07060, partial [Opitutaceae bacterium]
MIAPLLFRPLHVVAFLTALCGSNLSAETLSLAGEWRFALDPTAEQHTIIHEPGPAPALPEGEGTAQRWFLKNLSGHIRLPGILQAQGYGNDISVSTPWILTLGDSWWKLQPEELRAHFSQTGQVQV